MVFSLLWVLQIRIHASADAWNKIIIILLVSHYIQSMQIELTLNLDPNQGNTV